MSSKFRFIRVSTMDGKPYGSNNQAKMECYAGSEDEFVLDTETNEWLLSNGTRIPIEVDNTPWDPADSQKADWTDTTPGGADGF